MRSAVLLLAALSPTAAAAGGAVLFAGGGWAAIDRGAQCEAATRALAPVARGAAPGIASFAFSADRRRWGEFHARLSRVPRAGSSVMLTVGRVPFLLVAGGTSAWDRGGAQRGAIIAAARAGGMMRLAARDASGRRFSDYYPLDGAATAIDSAAARCAGKIAAH